MRTATVVLVLVLTSASVARADLVTLTARGFIESAETADAERHLGFPVFPGEPFVFSATLQPASPDIEPSPNIGVFLLAPSQLRFLFAPESFTSEFTSRFTSGTSLVVNDPAGDTVRFDLLPQTAPQFEFSLVFGGPASWLNSDAFALSRLVTPLPLDGSLSAISAVDRVNLMRGRVDTISLSPAPIPEPASMVLIGAGLLVLGGQRWRGRRATPPRE